ncbi:hypothetical protein C8J57DRAFT_1230919 [Mycena rebaudengoi]|nr:hypothetical protein C8J57DRAFT_1230919 [Mycena rebaudengoi]
MPAIDKSAPPTVYDLVGLLSFAQGVLTFVGVAIMAFIASAQQLRSNQLLEKRLLIGLQGCLSLLSTLVEDGNLPDNTQKMIKATTAAIDYTLKKEAVPPSARRTRQRRGTGVGREEGDGAQGGGHKGVVQCRGVLAWWKGKTLALDLASASMAHEALLTEINMVLLERRLVLRFKSRGSTSSPDVGRIGLKIDKKAS